MLIDYSTLRPPIPLLQAAGVTAVGRYIGYDCEPGFSCIRKNLTPPERDELLAAGISIWLSFEYTADAALNGASQGTKDAQLAARQLTALGAPHGTAVYYAIDFNLPDFAPSLPNDAASARAKLGPVAHYFDAINAEKLPWPAGVYGGYWAVKRVLDAGLAKYGWQTLAWSGTNVESRASLIQLIRQVFGAADVNIHESKAPDFGQFPRPAIPPLPAPGGPFEHWADGTQSLAQIATARGTTAAHLTAVSAPAYAHALTRQPLFKGTPYWTSNP